MIVHEIQIALFEHRHSGRFFIDHEHADFLDGGLAAKVARVGTKFDFVLVLPRRQTKGTVGHDISRLGPAGVEFFDDILALRIRDFKSRDSEKVSGRVAQSNDQGLIIRRLDADRRRRL